MVGQKTRIWLESYDHDIINSPAERIVETITSAGATIVGPAPLSTEKSVYVIVRLPHKYKDSREQLEVCTYKRLIDVINPTPNAVDSLMHLELSADMKIEVRL